MIYTTGGIKGGCGKSTIATNLTVYLANQGRDVLLVDADDQQTATDFTNIRTEVQGEPRYTAIQLYEMAVYSQVQQMKGKYDDIVIDTGGRDTKSQRAALLASDIYLVPFLPRSFDIWTLEKIEEVLEEVRTQNQTLKAYCFLNKADFTGSYNNEAAEPLRKSEHIEFIEAPLGYRKVYAHASSDGLGITEYKPKDAKAIAEIETLFKALDIVPQMVS